MRRAKLVSVYRHGRWCSDRSKRALVQILVALIIGFDADPRTTRADEPSSYTASCDCARFDGALAEASAIYDSRNTGITVPLTSAMHDRYRRQVEEAFARAECLIQCQNVPEKKRNGARMLLAEAGFKHVSFAGDQLKPRLTAVLAATTACLEADPDEPLCHLWHASSRGMLARGSWNPLNILLPVQLIAEFRVARHRAPPGSDPHDGAATRGEASLLLRVPRFAGGDPAAARALMEEAQRAATFACRVANRIVLAEAFARTGDLAAARTELRAILADGLPACGAQRYENALSLEQAARCLWHLTEVPDSNDPGWDLDCRPVK